MSTPPATGLQPVHSPCADIDPCTLNPDPCAAQWQFGIGQHGPEWLSTSTMTSACWYDIGERFFNICGTHNQSAPLGYPLNISLLASPSIGDFLSPSPTLGGSSVALLPPGADAEPTGWHGLERPVHEGAVDLITGSPLAQVKELELPFAGATFRLIRTRAQSQHLERFCLSDGTHPVDDTWDWAGDGWMIGESPLLLIDSAVADIVGNGPRTSYLVLDAHHAIPFQRMEDTGNYEAPARFRATLTHNGLGWTHTNSQSDDQHGHWGTEPTWYKATLYDGALTYWFVIIREDIPENHWELPQGLLYNGQPDDFGYIIGSMHDRPFLPQQFADHRPWEPQQVRTNPGQGIPYYGLCYRIEDRYGDVVDIELGSQHQSNIDDPQSTDCVECTQDCPAKGQIRSIKLRNGCHVYWTLLYRYRVAPRAPWDAAIVDPCQSDPQALNWLSQLRKRFDYFGRRTLDTIHVFRGDVTSSIATLPRTISTESRVGPTSGSASVNCLDGPDPAGFGLPTDLESAWVHRVRYHYRFQTDDATHEIGMLDKRPLLVKTSVTSRPDDAGTHEHPETLSRVRNWVFGYKDLGVNTSSGYPDPWLSTLFLPDAVDRATAHLGISVNGLALNLNTDSTHTYSPFVVISDNVDLASAHWEMLSAQDVLSVHNEFRSVPSAHPFVRCDTDVHYSNPWQGEAGSLVLTGSDGQARYFRFRRLMTEPYLNDPPRPMRSAFHAPYTWLGWDQGDNPPTCATPDYSKTRWIAVIDEFRDRQSYDSGAGLDQSTLTANGMLSRRVVQVSPSGVVLQDHSWRFTDAGEVVGGEGSGLGAENIYWPATRILEARNISLPPMQALTDDLGRTMGTFDPVGNVRNEVLLMERRSVGWSASSTPATEGLVHFFEYDIRLYNPDGSVVGSGDTPNENTRAKIDLVAEGIKDGQVYDGSDLHDISTSDRPRLYTQDAIHAPNPASLNPLPSNWDTSGLDDPGQWDFECDVTYLVPTQDGQRVRLGVNLPGPGSAPVGDPTSAITYRLTKRLPMSDGTPTCQWPVVTTLTVGPGRQLSPTSAWYFPVERHEFDDSGKEVRSITGLVQRPLAPNLVTSAQDPLQSLSHTVHLYDINGRPRHVIADVAAGSSGEIPSADDLNQRLEKWRPQEGRVLQTDDVTPFNSQPHCPQAWPRMESTGGGAARNYVTSFVYNGPGGRLSDVFYPNGRRWASRIIVIGSDESIPGQPNNTDLLWNQNDGSWAQCPAFVDSQGHPDQARWFAREYVFNDIETLSSAGGDGESSSRVIGEIRDYRNSDAVGSPARTRRVIFATTSSSGPDLQNPDPLSSFLTAPDPASQPRFLEEKRVELAIGSDGRITTANLLEADANGQMVTIGSKEVNDLVDVLRECSYDHTITRTTRDLFGHPLRRYLGTSDDGWAGGNANGLALLERFEYGTDPTNAWLPTTTRRYTKTPGWANDVWTIPATDPDGYVTQTKYDWRMRPVRVDQYGQNSQGNRALGAAPRVFTTLTYLDHADRPVVVATFGAGDNFNPPKAVDPSTRHDWSDGVRPTISALYSLDPSPSSVVETFYGPDGNVIRKKTYANATDFHEEFTYSGQGNQTVYEQRPQQPLTTSAVDGLGRTVSTSQRGTDSGGSWTCELAKTEYLVDADGNVCGTSRFERVLSGTSDNTLSASGGGANAIRTRSVTWYDPQKKLTACADLGSESRALTGAPDLLVACDPAYVRDIDVADQHEPSIASSGTPTISRGNLPDAASLSINRYSYVTGRLIWTANPDNTITQFEYDKAGRLKKKAENAFPSANNAGGVSRATEYEYVLGRLTGIKAQRTAQSGTPNQNYAQTTRLLYGARVLQEQPSSDANLPPTYSIGDQGIYNASWIGRMHLPDQDSGDNPAPSASIIPTDENPSGVDTGDIILRYTFDGQLAERIDARGVVFRYFYGHDNRLTWVVTGHYDAGDFSYKPAKLLTTPATPVDCVAAIHYLYDANGRLSDVVALMSATDPNSVITHVRYEYDTRGNLLREWQADQALGASPSSTIPHIDYQWAYQPTAEDGSLVGYDRLTQMTYPAPPGANDAARRVVQLAYGAAGSCDDRISRLTSMSSGTGTFIYPVASFTYAGVSRRSSMTLSTGIGAITADMRAGSSSGYVGLTGFDSFGRVRDLKYTNAASPNPEILFRAQHGYNASGDRLYDKVTQAPAAALNNGSQILDARSQLHTFDLFHRLTSSQVARVQSDSNGEPIRGSDGNASAVNNSTLRTDTWNLDLLGNWDPTSLTGNDLLYGRVSHGNLDGYAAAGLIAMAGGSNLGASFAYWQDPVATPTNIDDDLQLLHEVDGRNQVADVKTRLNPTSQSPTTTIVRYDAAGNLAFDGTFIYQFDAWGRLVQINAGAAIDPRTPPSRGHPYDGLIFGPMLKHYTYDGVGRLVRTQSPFPNVQQATDGAVRSERFYYDGVRRVQEVVIDPSQSLMMAMGSGDSFVADLGQQALTNAQNASGVNDPDAAPDAGVETGAAPMQLETSLGSIDQVGGPRLEREYVWGPGDSWGASPVDELLVYYAEARVAWWPLQDAGSDVVAVCANGPAVPTNAPARVVAQQTYDAYGQVVSADHIYNHPFLAVGHKGLFYDRLDRGVSDASAPGASLPPWATTAAPYGGGQWASVDTPRLVPFARGLYHVRNRAYIPGGGSPTSIGQPALTATGPSGNPWASYTITQNGLSSGAPVQGRWMQADPNATGMALVTALCTSGASAHIHLDRFELISHFADGTNTYEYLKLNAPTRADPLGTDTIANILVTGAIRAQLMALELANYSAGGIAALVASFRGAEELEMEEIDELAPEAEAEWHQIVDALGKIGEFAANITKNTTPITVNGVTRVPDVLDEEAMIIGEVKNCADLSLTDQIADMLSYAQQNGMRFDLFVRQSTELSKPLQDLCDNGEIHLFRALPW
jgi:hypothetical protein